MQIEALNSSSQTLDSHTTVTASYPVLLSACIFNMYSTPHVDIPRKVTMERMYSVNSAMIGETMPQVTPPKRENMFQSMFKALNVFWEHFSRIPGSLIANANNPLSVTVVQNEGIISHEFFKSLTSRKDPLGADSIYIHDIQRKESLGVMENISSYDYNSSFPMKISEDSITQNLKFETNRKNAKSMMDSKILPTCEIQELMIKRYPDDTSIQEKLRVTISESNSLLHGSSERTATKNNANTAPQITNLNNLDKTKDISKTGEKDTSKLDTSIKPCASFSDANIEAASMTSDWSMRKLIDQMWPTEILVRRSVSPQQRKKLNTVAKGRGRGRAKSQLRRSGVSQTRHRKERTKHDLVAEIQDDYESYQESETQDFLETNRTATPFCNVDVGVDVPDCAMFSQEGEHPKSVTFTLADVKPRLYKPKPHKPSNWNACKFTTRVRYVPECPTDPKHDYRDGHPNSERNGYRPRLISESSVDSEDSYCIVFETETEMTFKSDSDFEDENNDELSSEYEFVNDDEDQDADETEDENEEFLSSQKVKFNLKPVIHRMVQWDYAYRAARRGPWEEMARDRERFRGRINCIERVLNPILSTQHRSHIWQERFAFEV